MKITEKQAKRLRIAISRAMSTQLEFGHRRGLERALSLGWDPGELDELHGIGNSLYDRAADAQAAYNELMSIYSEITRD